MEPATSTDARALCASLLTRALTAAWPEHAQASLTLERPKDNRHGDYACNVALQLARQLKRSPRDIAGSLVDALPPAPFIEKVEIAGAGFINLFLKLSFKQSIVAEVLGLAAAYGQNELGRRKKVQVEFVSANPTGPLHVGHGRGAAFGASLANVLAASGFDVQREYYVNDAGRQMDILALSTWLRYLELAGERVPFPPNAYQGDYVRDMARALIERAGTRFVRPASAVTQDPASVEVDPEAHLDALIARAKALLGPGYETIHAHALATQLEDCRSDLTEFGVDFRSLVFRAFALRFGASGGGCRAADRRGIHL